MKPDVSRAGSYLDKMYNSAIMAFRRPIHTRGAESESRSD